GECRGVSIQLTVGWRGRGQRDVAGRAGGGRVGARLGDERAGGDRRTQSDGAAGKLTPAEAATHRVPSTGMSLTARIGANNALLGQLRRVWIDYLAVALASGRLRRATVAVADSGAAPICAERLSAIPAIPQNVRAVG